MPHRLLPATCVFGSFFFYSLLTAPIPGVNEPHYLGKARHYWDREWCRGDFFLDSTDTHIVFYETVGRMTRWLDLPQTACVGRLLAMLLLAAGWCRFVSRILPGRWVGLWSAWIFLSFASLGNLSGEWIVGGIEAKVVSYGFVFFSLAFLIDQSWFRCAICAGLAISFHPIVGIWSLSAGSLAALISANVFPIRRSSDPHHRSLLLGGLVALLLLSLCALPGLLPVLHLLDARSAESSYQANYIQIYYRLTHHLDPKQFLLASYVGYLLLLVFWIGTRRWRRAVMFDRGLRVLTWYLAGTLLIALAGLAIGLGPKPVENMQYAFRLSLMKFYPFRSVDVTLPIAASLALVACCTQWNAAAIPSGRAEGSAWKTWLLCVGLLVVTASVAGSRRQHASHMDQVQRENWMDACQWVAQNTPAGAVFLTPKNSWAFKWYAQRAEYVSFKDCPQDAAGVVEWNRRLRYLKHWAEARFDNGYSEQAVRELQRQTGITHVLAPRRGFGPFETPQIYQNKGYKVFQLAKPPTVN